VKHLDGWGVFAIAVVCLLILLIIFSTWLVQFKKRCAALVAKRCAIAAAGAQTSDEARSAQLLVSTEVADSNPHAEAVRLPLAVQAFSLIGPSGTIKKLFEIPSYKPTDCLNGLRVLSMIWIIVGHTFLMPNGVSGYMNSEDVLDSELNLNAAENNPLFMLVISAGNGVDTFFFYVRVSPVASYTEGAAIHRRSHESHEGHRLKIFETDTELGLGNVDLLQNLSFSGTRTFRSKLSKLH